MRSHKLILAWNAHLVHRKFGFRRYRAGMILLTASFIRLSPLRNGEQGVKYPFFLHQLVEAAGFGDTAKIFSGRGCRHSGAGARPPACGSRRRRVIPVRSRRSDELVFPIPPARPAAAFPAATSDHFLASFSPVYHKMPCRARRNRTSKNRTIDKDPLMWSSSMSFLRFWCV